MGRPFVELYINNQKVYFKEPPEIFVTYAHTDLHNPTVVKNSYTKTVTVEGTPENNRIFNNFYDLKRINNPDLFNPSRKETFTLYRNGEPMETGYVKLDKVNKKNGRITYDITLYGGLGQFLYNLQYKEDGEQMKLSDLEYSTGFDFTINRYTVSNAWNHLINPNPNIISTPYDVINFAPCYNGIPDNFTANKVAIYASDMDVNLDLIEEKDGYGLVNGWMIGEFNEDYDEWKTKDLRSYLQRPVIRFKEIIQACCKPENNGGYKVDLDADFFNEQNPYYENAWMTLPLLSEMEMEDDSNDDISATININNDIITVDGVGEGNTFTVEFSIGIGCDIEDDDKPSSLRTNRYMQSWDGSSESSPVDESTNVARYLQIVAYDSEGNIIDGSAVYSFCTRSVMTDNFSYTPEYNSTINDKDGKYILQKDGTYLFNNEHYVIPMKNIVYQDGMYFKVIEKISLSQSGLIKPDATVLYNSYSYDDEEGSTTVYYPYNVKSFYNEIAPSSKVHINLKKQMIKKEVILNSENTPCDYFLSYLKMFNLHIWKDMYENLIYVRQRKNFFSDEIKDIEEWIDRGDEITIKPLTFENKWLNFNFEMVSDTELAKNYLDEYGIDYGCQKIDTNYNFDNSSKDIFEKSVFKNTIQSRGRTKYYVDIYNKETDLRSIPSAFMDGCQTFLFNNENDTTEGTYITPKTSALSVNWWKEKYYDIFPKPNFVDKDNNAVDGANVLLFFNGVAELDDVNGKWAGFYLTDDIPEFEQLNEGEPCWIYVCTNYTDIAIDVGRLPMFSRYLVNENGWVTHSWDFGTPKALYVPDYNIDETSSLYTQYWKPYIRDQYDTNTRVVECKVLLKERVLGDWLQRFYYWDGRYWIMNKITDYNPASNGTTKCEFITVNNIQNYLT